MPPEAVGRKAAGPAPAHASGPVHPLRIGLIVDGVQVSRYVDAFARETRGAVPSAEFVLLVVQEIDRRRGFAPIREIAASGGLRALARRVMHWALLRFERLMLRRHELHRDHFATVDGRWIAPAVCRVRVLRSKSGFVYRYPPESLEEIRAFGLDVLIRFGSGILKGDILGAARHGVISFHHGDNRINRGGPPGFWEVFHRQDCTGFTLQQLTEELDGGRVLMRGCFPTQGWYLLNRAFVYRKSNVYLALLLSRLSATGDLPVLEGTAIYSGPLYRLPGTRQQISYLLGAALRLLLGVVRHRMLKRRYRWSVGFCRGDWKGSVLWRASQLPSPPGHLLADPFVIAESGSDFVFVEDFEAQRRRGHISVYRLDGGEARRLGPALVEDFHVSFPFLFRHGGELFMCPETAQARQIRLYRCVEFPLRWELHKVLLDGVEAVDSMIFEHGGRWWLFTNIDPSASGDYASELFIFHGEDPLGPWTPHSGNPVIVDSRKARNAGILFDGAEVFRVAQRYGFRAYGESLTINRIARLDSEDYREEKICTIEPRLLPKISRTHHFHSNGRVTVFDFARLQRMR